MSDWSGGYVSSLDYTFGHRAELNPLRLRLALLSQGFCPPENRAACELGFGQGVSVNLHAAASETAWWGTDFLPSHASQAQHLARITGANAHLHDQSFAEFCRRSDLPDFDFIGLHGIWSWVSEENRALLVDFLRRKLKVGGVAYISYNVQPGWAVMAPLRRLMTLHVERLSASGADLSSRIDAALAFAGQLVEQQSAFARQHPEVAERLVDMQGSNRHYLAHEFFNQDWQPMLFAELAACLAPGRLEFACSADYNELFPGLSLTDAQRLYLSGIPDVGLRETVRDFYTNCQFRKDYWAKGARRLNLTEQVMMLRQETVVLVQPRTEIAMTRLYNGREIRLDEALYTPILNLLADYQPKSLGEIELRLASTHELPLAQLTEAVLMLIAHEAVAPAQPATVSKRCRPACERYNRYMMEQAQDSDDINWLASPVTGGGIRVYRFEQLFLLAHARGRKGAEAWAEFAWETLSERGERLIKDGEPLEREEDNRRELERQAREFAEKRWPLLRALHVHG